MFIFTLFMQFIAFPERKDSLLVDARQVLSSASGSLGFYYGGKCHQSFPNQTLISDEKQEWCSNVGSSQSETGKPWIAFSLRGKRMKLTGYSLRNGCCYYTCCCVDDDTLIDDSCCCMLYSFSLQGSNDNITWKTLHNVEKDNNFHFCETKTYSFQETDEYEFIRLILDKEYPHCKFCMAINEIALYGKAFEASHQYNNYDNDNEDSVSIIGKIKRGDAL